MPRRQVDEVSPQPEQLLVVARLGRVAVVGLLKWEVVWVVGWAVDGVCVLAGGRN